jgi:hypothetical protein
MNHSTKDPSPATTVDESAHKSLTETVVEAVEGTDQPMEEVSPSAPGVLVLGVYPILLMVTLLGGLLFFYFFAF